MSLSCYRPSTSDRICLSIILVIIQRRSRMQRRHKAAFEAKYVITLTRTFWGGARDIDLRI